VCSHGGRCVHIRRRNSDQQVTLDSSATQSSDLDEIKRQLAQLIPAADASKPSPHSPSG
jgi:hypothetical protein